MNAPLTDLITSNSWTTTGLPSSDTHALTRARASPGPRPGSGMHLSHGQKSTWRHFRSHSRQAAKQVATAGVRMCKMPGSERTGIIWESPILSHQSSLIPRIYVYAPDSQPLSMRVISVLLQVNWRNFHLFR
ncbi:hypothetical protein PoB_006630400 [Plakobranchus ocellatus]|uniref:Uncharacterized protein n=1 Tax=Plakobranchus ocellatus TaxID=259542 RepID=A0AAV4D6I2_9GAST|nr:hypothetical protein PoB_006630400 [Plakobranchus ocellatus]